MDACCIYHLHTILLSKSVVLLPLLPVSAKLRRSWSQITLVRWCTDRDMLKLTQQEYDSVPLPIMVEVLAAAVLCMWGAPLIQSWRPHAGLPPQPDLSGMLTCGE